MVPILSNPEFDLGLHNTQFQHLKLSGYSHLTDFLMLDDHFH